MPHLQALVQRHQDDPFTLIGINAFDDEEAYRGGLEKFGVTWLSAYQGKENTISDGWAIEGFPTYVLIDAEGKIRERGHLGDEMDAPIAELLAELERSKGGGE